MPMRSGDHLLRTETILPVPRLQVFGFFADPVNLQRITPPELDFEIVSVPERMEEGAVIDYRLRLFGMPFVWKTLISTWEEGRRFVDEQTRGPYALWVHTHIFDDHPDGTHVTDEVRYRLPLRPFGELAHPLVRRQLRRIFAYRSDRLKELIG